MSSRKEIIFGKICNIKVAIDYSWFWLFLLMSWTFGAKQLPLSVPGMPSLTYVIYGFFGSILFFISIALHELAHVIVAKTNRIEIKKISLFIFGGIHVVSKEAAISRAELKIAVIGSIVSCVIGMLQILWANYFAREDDLIISSLLQLIGKINIFFALFNLLPGYPLDGGRALKAILSLKNNNPSYSIGIVNSVSQIIFSLIILIGFLFAIFVNTVSGLWAIVIGFILLQVSRQKKIKIYPALLERDSR